MTINKKQNIKKNQKIEVITPEITKKNKKVCREIYNKYDKECIHDDNKPFINIPKLMEIIVTVLKPKVNPKFCNNQKFTEIDFINGIVEIIRNCMYWRRYKNGKIDGEYLRKRHKKYCEWGVYNCLYIILLDVYFSKNKFGKLKNQSFDTTFCINLYGSEMKGRNVKYKSKNGIKISTIDDNNGTPFSLAIASGNVSDNIILNAMLETKNYIIYEAFHK